MAEDSDRVALRVRLDNIDYSVTTEPSCYDNCSLPLAPILRVYGNASNGSKACVNIHQVYPYIFVQYSESLDPPTVNRYASRLHRSLNTALALSKRKNPLDSASQYIRAVVLVKGIPFYGFHCSYAPFLKIYVADPKNLSRITTILRLGKVMGTKFEVFESHLGAILQFFCDYGLYGCGWLDLERVRVRGDNYTKYGNFEQSELHKESRMDFEIDVIAHEILNRHNLVSRNIHHELTLPALPLPAEPLVESVRELWEDERRRRAAKDLDPSPIIPSVLGTTERGKGGGWETEEASWEAIMRRIEEECGLETSDDENKEWEQWVMTTFESVQALWEDDFKTWRPSCFASNSGNPFVPSSFEDIPNDESADVDKDWFDSQDIDTIEEQEQAERARKTQEWERLNLGQPDIEHPEEREIDDIAVSPGLEHPTSVKDGESSNEQANQQTPTKRSSQGSQTASQQLDPLASEVTPRASNRYLALSEAVLPPSQLFKNAHPLPLADESAFSDPFWIPAIIDDPGEAQAPLPIAVQSDLLLEDLTALPQQKAGYFPSSSEARLSSSGEEQTGNSDEEDSPHQIAQRPAKRKKLVHLHSPIPQQPLPKPIEIYRSTGQGQDEYPPADHNSVIFNLLPPTTDELLSTLGAFGVPDQIFQDPSYHNEEDIPEMTREYSGLLYDLTVGGSGVGSLEKWRECGQEHFDLVNPPSPSWSLPDIYSGWEYAEGPPRQIEVLRWLAAEDERTRLFEEKKAAQKSQKTTAKESDTTKEIKLPPAQPDGRVRQSMTIMTMELVVETRDNLQPDPPQDRIVAIAYCFLADDNYASAPERRKRYREKIFVVDDAGLDPSRLRNIHIERVRDELDLINEFVTEVWLLDPDILAGWQVQTLSWGYLASRGETYYDMDVAELLGRAPARYSVPILDRWGLRHMSTFKVVGRHVLNVWRVMRSEQTVAHYSYENFVFHVLKRRVPLYSHATLREWYNSGISHIVLKALKHVLERAIMVLEMLEETEVITKNAEFARVFGIDFFSVLNRGSQFKVESFMFRIAKPESFVLPSPSAAEVGRQNAAECLPLIMEPKSAFYKSPLLVLDFQSLYPSVMIAYNYCYSTCLGRVHPFRGTWKIGTRELQLQEGLLERLQEHITVAPNRMIYVKQSARKGLLSKMLTEILDTRVMVKQAMKNWAHGEDRELLRVLDARQLGLKYIANTTYGYTSASFSGRMPMVEIADSIVQTGRETLENAIDLIQRNTTWGAQVVYGDTDSLFVYLPGKTKDEAFRIGHSIADAVTAQNPAPIKLKFEKVYLPCVLLAKKRYVGYKYEDPDQKMPDFDAKGIETVRRDGIPAVRQTMKDCIEILFRTQDLSAVKEHCQNLWFDILKDRVSIQDFIFAKEQNDDSETAPPQPGVVVATARMALDSNSEPQYGERVPYVICQGEPGSRLADRAFSPHDVLQDRNKHLDGEYYITRVIIPPLARIFNLVGADVQEWYDDLPRPDVIVASIVEGEEEDRPDIDTHFEAHCCQSCGELTEDNLCGNCAIDPEISLPLLQYKQRTIDQRLRHAQMMCSSCTATLPAEPIPCETLDCEWMYARVRAGAEARGSDNGSDLDGDCA